MEARKCPIGFNMRFHCPNCHFLHDGKCTYDKIAQEHKEGVKCQTK